MITVNDVGVERGRKRLPLYWLSLMNVIPFREMGKIFLFKKTLTEGEFSERQKKVREWKRRIRELQTIYPN